MGKRRKSGRTPRKPDDYFSAGPFEFARFGKMTIGRSHLSPEKMEDVHKRMANDYPRIVAEINSLVESITKQISSLPPDKLLHRAWWQFAHMMITGESRLGVDELTALRMVDYVQSLIAAVTPEAQSEDVSEEAWSKLSTDIETLFTRLSLEFQHCLTAHRKIQNPELDMELEGFRVRAELMWLNVRGKRYHAHEKQALLDVLIPHSDALERIYGISADQLVNELDKILNKLTRGLHDTMMEMEAFQNDTMNRVEEAAKAASPNTTFDEIRDSVFQDAELAERRDRLMGELFGLDLFDVAKNTSLPEALIKDLTWRPGEAVDFLSVGEYQGWPQRIWPIMQRPFIMIGERAYCFDIFSLFDNIYRVLRRVVVQRDPNYAGTWNTRQKERTETLPMEYLLRILPGATVYGPVYYKWKVGTGSAEWHEADGILIYCDHLFVVEVKAGAYTYTSPANDIAAHLSSLKNLLEAPAKQGARFVDYLESAPEVTIANAEHQEIAKLRRQDFRHITVCAVTLDSFTELAARAQHLGSVGIKLGARPVWPLSIDDLRVYSEVFDNPLCFLHFVEQRMKAAQSEDVDLADELDHLGLYLEQNNYTMFASEMKGRNQVSKLNFDGYRKPIDEYYSAVIQGRPRELLRQKMPPFLAEIIGFLAETNEPSRAELTSFLLDASGDFREELARAIEVVLRESTELGRVKPISFYGGMAATIFTWPSCIPKNKNEALDHTRAVLVAGGEQERPLIELEYDDNNKLIKARMTHVSLSGLSLDELEKVKRLSEKVVVRRLEKARLKEKIGRNDQCPCGSGRKYKKCHGNV